MGKYIYEKESVAIEAALRTSKAFSIPTRYYPCPSGNGFHITTKVRRT